MFVQNTATTFTITISKSLYDVTYNTYYMLNYGPDGTMSKVTSVVTAPADADTDGRIVYVTTPSATGLHKITVIKDSNTLVDDASTTVVGTHYYNVIGHDSATSFTVG